MICDRSSFDPERLNESLHVPFVLRRTLKPSSYIPLSSSFLNWTRRSLHLYSKTIATRVDDNEFPDSLRIIDEEKKEENPSVEQFSVWDLAWQASD